MEWIELLEKHQTEWDELAKLKDRAWQRIAKDNQAILAAFGGDLSRVPEGTRDLMIEREARWTKQWGMDGKEMADLKSKQQWERRAFINERKREFAAQIRRNIERQRQSRKARDKSKEDDHEIG